ncbi:RagB/SusD family nutrient uptake outer membrane protein [Proteiniphilum saccharofermentans]|uniref:RagB/SusD family nutrient uptake outer membrane protein n=1 Tax=Proteiniphilum saccharofermentans TaxID=1642647 RepID=UPI0028AE7258|nr:RagB/SusD family nutrient uptake outer membrane protein [Proteiniphilum saccharofermentans]
MKTYIYILLSILLFISCGDYLDLYSRSAIPPEAVTEGDLPALRIGMYNFVQNKPGVRAYMMHDILGGGIQTNTGSARDLINTTLSPLNTYIQGGWDGYFNALYQVNTVVEVTDRFSSAQSQMIKGEALYFRAYIYFCLATRWGGVPILEKNTLEKVSRNSMEEVWAFIDRDLALATELLTDAPKSYYYVSKDAAIALRARAALSSGDYPNAAKYAESLITKGKYKLDSFDKIFRKRANDEIIFAFENRTEESSINISDLYYTYDHPNRGQGVYRPTDAVVALFADEDKRKEMTLVNIGGRITINKYESGQTGRDPVIISRIAELYLISAEAQGLGNGIGRLNELRIFRGLAPVSAANSQEYLDLILEERVRELIGENFMYHDYVRAGVAVEKLGILPHQVLHPIPGRELQNNPNLTPNPGY